MRIIRTIKSAALAIGLSLAGAIPSTGSAQSLQDGYVTRFGTGTTGADAIFPAAYDTAAILKSYDLRVDTNNALLTLYAGTASASIATTNTSTSTNMIVSSGADSFASNDVIVVQLATDQCIAATVWGVSGTTNIIPTAAIGTALPGGTKIYKMGTNYVSKLLTTTTNAIVRHAGEALLSAPKRQPLLLRISGGSSSTAINSAVVKYQ
jgi:hypothetical protein